MQFQPHISFTPNSLVYGDCLEVLQQWAEQGRRVDLIYLDPPFNSNVNYHVIYKERRPGAMANPPQHRAFGDMWSWHPVETAATLARLRKISANRALGKTIAGLETILGNCGMLAYVAYMAERIYHMHRILRDTGSIYLHCDPTASYYLRLVLNAVFGADNYRNEIVWHYGKWTNVAKHFQRNHDTILFYSKSDDYNFNRQYGMTPSKEKTLRKGWLYNVTSGKNRRRQLLVYDRAKAEEQIAAGKYEVLVDLTDKPEGVALPSVWNDIPALRTGHREYLNYPTQKPLQLLRRIIAASSNPGDLVLDPFCGCGTAAEASYIMTEADGKTKAPRKFIGIDISPYAINQVCRRRLKNVAGLTVQGIPSDVQGLKDMYAEDHKKWMEIEKLCLTSLPGIAPNDRQVGDGGVDGWGSLLHQPIAENGQKLPHDCIAQVKMGKPTADSIRAFAGKLVGGGAAIGVFITLDKYPLTRTMQAEIHRAGQLTFAGAAKSYPRLIFWSMEEFYRDQFPRLPDFTNPNTGKPMQAEIS